MVDVFYLFAVPQSILLHILAKMRWSALNKTLMTNKSAYYFVKENWNQLKKVVRFKGLHVRYDNLYQRAPRSRTNPEPLDLSNEWLKGLNVDLLHVEDIEWNSHLVEKVFEIFNFFQIEVIHLHFPKLPCTAELLGKIRPAGIVLNISWNVKYWREALPALQNARTVNMSNGRCSDLFFLTEKQKEVAIRPVGEGVTELRKYITDCYYGKKKPCPLIYGETLLPLRIEDFCEKNVLYKWHSFTLHGLIQHLYVIDLPNGAVLALALYRRDFTLKLFSSAGHAKRNFNLYGYELRRIESQ